MFRNYFILNRFILDAEKLITGFKVSSIFSQEKDILMIMLTKGDKEKFIEISASFVLPFIILKHNFHRAKKNTIDFFTKLTGETLQSVQIAKGDRIIKMEFDNSALYFAIRGNSTNVYLFNKNGEIESFKKIDDSNKLNFSKEILNYEFIDYFYHPEFMFSADYDIYNQLKKYPYIGKEIIAEFKYRTVNLSINEKVKTLNQILGEIEFGSPAVFIDKDSGNISLGINSFHIFPFSEKVKFEDVNSALNFLLGKKYFFSDIIEKKKKIRRHLDGELRKISAKLNDIKARIDYGSKEADYNKIANLLLINLQQIKPGTKEIIVDDIFNNSIPITIKLNETILPNRHADYYFSKARSERTAFQNANDRFKILIKQYERLKLIEESFSKANTIEEHNILMRELKLKDDYQSTVKNELKDKFKHYIIENKYHVYVGRDSQNNDLLTTKFAKQNDYWFHARSVPGSHVILRIENTKEAVSKSILKAAAALAAYHSKAKTSGIVPVAYTLKKYVVKRKGMEPGKVALLKEEVFIVRPEIPKNCEYISND